MRRRPPMVRRLQSRAPPGVGRRPLGAYTVSPEVVVTDPRCATPDPGAGFRRELLGVRFPVEARIAQGTLTVRGLLDLGPGSIVRSESPVGARVLLCVGRVVLAAAEPFVEEGRLVVRVERIEAPDA